MEKDINELRIQINEIDAQLVELFLQRMEVSKAIGKYKVMHDLPVHDSQRERELIAFLTEGKTDAQKSQIETLYTKIFEISKGVQ